MIKTIIMIMKYSTIIAKLAKEWLDAESVTEKSLVCLKANSVKNECAELVIKGKMSTDIYNELFKVNDNNGKHFLEIWAENGKN